MMSRGSKMLLLLALLCGALQTVADGQRKAAENSSLNPCTAVQPPSVAAIQAAQRGAPYLNLCDGHSATAGQRAAIQSSSQQAPGVPLALASGDLDGDGVPDLVSGYAAGGAGIVRVYRGNIQALWPYGAALRNGPPAAFLSDATQLAIPETPDFLAVGDFNADGHLDIVAAAQGGSILYFLLGDGHGGFSAPQAVRLPGAITALASGEINRVDGLEDIAVGITAGGVSQLLVLESPRGAMRAEPEVFEMPSAVTALALGGLSGSAFSDVAIGAGNQLLTLHGRDRKLSAQSGLTQVEPAKVTQQSLPFSIKALATGSFSGLSNLAALGDDGAIHLMENAGAVANVAQSALAAGNFRPTGAGKAAAAPNPTKVTRTQAAAQLAARRASAVHSANAAPAAAQPEWTVREAVSLPQSVNGVQRASRQLVTGRVSSSPTTDLLVLDSSAKQVHVVANTVARDNIRHHATSEASVAQEQMSHLTSLDVSGAPAAVLAMRLNQHPLQGVVMLAAGQADPIAADSQPALVETVTSTDFDTVNNALTFAGAAAASLGSAELAFNIPLTDPGCDPITHVCTISPLSGRTGACNGLVWSIYDPVTMDGYTQPGSSPNTLQNGDNAVILIRFDGALATTPGGSGMQIFDSAGTIRGIDFTGWNRPDYACEPGYSTGGFGVDVDGVADYLEGNFIGVDPTGTSAAPNGLGVFVENGPELGWNTAPGNVIGGTVPQARNIISGNSGGGIEVFARVDLTQIQGNFIGTDKSGTQGIANPMFGVFASERTTIGGTVPGAGNLISFNGNGNVMMNSSANGVANIVQGNLIGTDITGTKPLRGGGVSIIYNYEYALIGGTSPAARNVISGNGGPGIWVDMVWLNTIQGNYIGTDVTGTVALPNGGAGIVSNDGTIQWEGASKPVANVFPAFLNTIGGTVPGAGNLISGNTSDGISIAGATMDYNGVPITGCGGCGTPEGNSILGNMIGTDATGTNAIPNGGNGIHLLSGTDAVYGTTMAQNNVIGGSVAGAANVISNNTGHGIFIESGSSNQSVSNVIHNNGGAGVRVASGNQNLISQNSIYGNGALGIDVDAAGENSNSHCQANVTGANNLQNAPVLTAGSGSTYLSATATDPKGNTSEFSNTVAAGGSVLNALGTFDGLPGTTFTIEFFSSPSADASGYGQGETYLGSTTVTTPATCDSNLNTPLDPTQADLSVSLTAEVSGFASTSFSVGPASGSQTFASTVVNHGVATAHNVVWTGQIPANLTIVNSGQSSCMPPVTTDRGNCSLSSNLITCNLGTMNPGDTANISVPVEATTLGTASVTANVSATEPDPNLANNTATATVTIGQVVPYFDHLDPGVIIAGSGDTAVMVYGTSMFPTTTVTINGTQLPVIAFYDNQTCYYQAIPSRCEGLQVVVPGSMLTAATDASVKLANGSVSLSWLSTVTGWVASACTYNLTESGFPVSSGVGAYGGVLGMETWPNAPSCTWTVSAGAPWMTILDTNMAAGGSMTGTGLVNLFIPPNPGASRSGNYTQAGQTFTFTEAGGPACTYTPDTTSATVSAAAGSGTVNITASDQNNCMWQGWSYSDWIKVPSNGVIGNGSMSFTYAANHGAPRIGWFLMGAQLYTLTQNAADACYFTLSSSSATIPTSGGSGSFNVVASDPACAWTASVDLPFTTVSPASGSGNQTITYNTAQNTGDGRTANITVGNTAGSYQTYVVTQVSANVCTTSLAPSTVTVSDEGATGIFQLNESYSFCKWAAVSNDPSALLLGSTGTSSTPYGYTVTKNTGPARVLTATIGCQTFTVNQGGAAPGNPIPVLTSLQPASTPVGATNFILTVNGSNFVSGSTVLYNGVPRVTTFVSASQLTAALLNSDIDTVGTATIEVSNPVPGGGVSTTLPFNITGQNPVPAISSLSPASALSGGGNFTLIINGTGFTSASAVSFAGTARAATLFSTTELTIPVGYADIAWPGTAAVVVTNPSPGGGASNSVTFNINAPVPTLSTISPTSGTLGPGPVILSVFGSNFTNTSVLNLAGVPQATSYVSSNFLIGIMTNLDTAGTLNVTVTNPAPGGGTSNALPFTVSGTNPAPTETSLQPSVATSGGGAFSLTVNGTNFLSTSVVSFNGSPRATSYVSTTQVTATILASDIASGGSYAVTVSNPTPGGGTSNALALAVNNPTPAITGLQPSSVNAGSAAFTLAVNGTGFIPASTVTFNGSSRTTSFVSATQLTAAISAADVSAVGSASVSVTNPAPGGGAAAAASFAITAAPAAQAVLSQTSLSFPSTTVGSTASAESVTLSNPGNAPLNISGINLAGNNPADFAYTATCGSTLAAGSNCSISVTFTPAAAANYSATLFVADNATGSPQSVSVRGTGMAVLAPAVSLTPTTLSFAANTGTTSSAQSVTLSNTGTAALSITGISITGSGASDFSETNNCGGSLAASGSCSISVTFTPASATTFSATLSVADNASGSPHTATLTGTGSTVQSDYAVSSASSTQSVSTGGAASYTILVVSSPAGSTYAGAVTLSATGLPTGATASFNPATVTPGSSSASSTLTIQTEAAARTAANAHGGRLWPLLAPALTVLFGGFGFAFSGAGQRRRKFAVLLLLLAVVGIGFFATSCGGGFAMPSTSNSTTYVIAVTGTSGETQRSTTVTLIVQ